MRSSKSYHWLDKILLFTATILVHYVQGEYKLEVKTHSYDNPTNGCQACNPRQGSCCDNFCCDDRQDCSGEQRCDNFFYYCVREPPPDSEPYSTNCDPGILTNINFDSTAIDYSQITVLGKPNPMSFNVSNTWQKVQVYISVFDYNKEENNPLIDWFLFNFPIANSPLGVRTKTKSFTGIYGFSTIEVSLRKVCADNYYGPDCSEFCSKDNCAGDDIDYIDNCVGVTCSGNGQCEDGVNSFTCLCNSGFAGQLCEINVDDCAWVDCSGNGQCEDGVNSFTCACNSGFNGQLCETNIDDCAGVDCYGNGQCEDGINSFTCVCNFGFTGQFCETNIDNCVWVDCSGNGHCEDGINSFTCVCNSGFTGQLCEINIDDCAGLDCSGNGQCEDGVESFICVCDSGFTGDLCNDLEGASGAPTTEAHVQNVNTLLSSPVGKIIGGLLGGGVLLGLILGVIICLNLLMKRHIKSTSDSVNQHGNAMPGHLSSPLRVVAKLSSFDEPSRSQGYRSACQLPLPLNPNDELRSLNHYDIMEEDIYSTIPEINDRDEPTEAIASCDQHLSQLDNTSAAECQSDEDIYYINDGMGPSATKSFH